METDCLKNSKYKHYFTRCTNNATYVKCNQCAESGRESKYKLEKGDSTKSIKTHLLKKHKISLDSESSPPLVINTLQMCLHHNIPIAILDCKCFRQFIVTLRDTTDHLLVLIQGFHHYLKCILNIMKC